MTKPTVTDTEKELLSPISVRVRMFFKTDLFKGIHYVLLPQSFLRIWSHSLKKSLMENFIFYAVKFTDDF